MIRAKSIIGFIVIAAGISFVVTGLYLILSGLILGGILFAMSFNDIYSTGVAFEKITDAKIVHLAPIFDTNPYELVLKLKNAGVSTVSTELSLNEIAEANNMDVHEIMESLIR